MDCDVNIKKETYKLRAFADDLMLVLEGPLKGIELLMVKFKEFSALAILKAVNRKYRF